MEIFLQRQQNAQSAQSVFNDLKRIVETPQNKVFAYDDNTTEFGLIETYFEVYAPNGNLILKCVPGITQAGAYDIFLPAELNKQLVEICAKHAIKKPDVTKFQVAQLSTYLKRFQGKSI